MFRPPSLLASTITPTTVSNLAGQPRTFTSQDSQPVLGEGERPYEPVLHLAAVQFCRVFAKYTHI